MTFFGQRLATIEGNTPLVQSLLERGADPNACRVDLPSHYGTNCQYMMPLFHAIRDGHEEIVALLLAAGADPNGRYDIVGDNALHWASGHAAMASAVRMLLEAGADPNIRASNGDPPLKLATECGNSDIVQLLEDAGAKRPEAVTSLCHCGVTITAIPGWGFTCPSCGLDKPQWHPPAFYIRLWVEEGSYGRDDEAKHHASRLLESPEAVQAAAVDLSSTLYGWETGYRSRCTKTMRACKEHIENTMKRVTEVGGEALRYEVCMAMPPHLRHVSSSDFDTHGHFLGEKPVSSETLCRYTRYDGNDPEKRRSHIEHALQQLGGGVEGFEMLMWRLANAAMDGESDEEVLQFLCDRVLKNALTADHGARALLDDAIEELHSHSPSRYFDPKFTNLSRFEK